jgi:hypothetical protein
MSAECKGVETIYGKSVTDSKRNTKQRLQCGKGRGYK